MSTTAAKVKRHLPTITVDVDVQPEDLYDAGWHPDSECKELADEAIADAVAAIGLDQPLGPAVASLHRQAHPSQPRDVGLCREEPCRSLTLDQLRQVGSQ
jgi:hypothetical protein